MQLKLAIIVSLISGLVVSEGNPALYKPCPAGSKELKFCEKWCAEAGDKVEAACSNFDDEYNYCTKDVFNSKECTVEECDHCSEFAGKGNYCHCGLGIVKCEVPRLLTPKPKPGLKRQCTTEDTVCNGSEC